MVKLLKLYNIALKPDLRLHQDGDFAMLDCYTAILLYTMKMKTWDDVANIS